MPIRVIRSRNARCRCAPVVMGFWADMGVDSGVTRNVRRNLRLSVGVTQLRRNNRKLDKTKPAQGGLCQLRLAQYLVVDDDRPMDRMVHHTVMDYGVVDNTVMDHPMRRHMVHRVMDHMMRRVRLGQHGRRGEGRGQGEAGGGYHSFHRKPPVGKLEVRVQCPP